MRKKDPNPIDVHVGSRVRMRRMLVGLSQEKLGERLGLTFQQVQKYEKGSNRISASRLYRMAQILGVPVQFFFEGLPNPPDAEPETKRSNSSQEADAESAIMDFLSSSEGLQLNRAFTGIREPSVRRKVVELVKAMAGQPNEA